MSVQAQINRSIGIAAAAASVGEGLKLAKEKQEKEAAAEQKAAEKEALKKAKEEKAEAGAAKIEERQDLIFREQSQKKIESARRSMADLEPQIAEAGDKVNAAQKRVNSLNNLRNKGGMKGEEARASLDDAISQQRLLQNDYKTWHDLLKKREQLVADLGEVNIDGER